MKNIAAKMVQAMAAIDAVEKKGRNQAQGYGYVKATDVANEVRNALHEAGVAFTYQVLSERFWESPTKSGALQFYCSLHVQGTFTDDTTGECLSSSAIGWGADTQDKAPYKAMTGALKYLLRTTFLIPDELDPENDAAEKAVRAEVERQKTATKKTLVEVLTPVSTTHEYVHLHADMSTIPPVLDWSYNSKTGILICRIVDATIKTKKNSDKQFVAVKINQSINGKDMAFYWHNSHRELLLNAIGKVVKMEVTEDAGKLVTIENVLEVDGQKVPQSPRESKTEGDTSIIRTTSSGSEIGMKQVKITKAEQDARWIGSDLDYDDENLRELLNICKGDWNDVRDHLKTEKKRREVEIVEKDMELRRSELAK